MIPLAHEEEKKEAFRLFEDGRYRESLQSCSRLLASEKDPAVEVLFATNLFYTGKLDDAEACFRDLVQRMPDSSYVHSYLAKVLEGKGEDEAIAEYALAIQLDPTNPDALRSYSAYLLSRQDYEGAIPVLRRLVSLSRNNDDAMNLVRALIGIRDASEALSVYRTLIGEQVKTGEYTDALLLSGDFYAAAAAALDAYRQSGDPALFRKHLAALSRYDVPASLEGYREYTKDTEDLRALADYAGLLSRSGEGVKALDIFSRVTVLSDDPEYRLLACEMAALHGSPQAALAHYERLIADELKLKDDLGLLARIIGNYRRLILQSLPAGEALSRFLSTVSKDVNTASLLETARFYEGLRNTAEARSWYYRAYRADFLTGGAEYARFLALNNETRECEKVMLYILANARRNADLYRVAAVIVEEDGPMHRMRRLMDQLVARLDERRMNLNTEGLGLLAAAYRIAARNALEEADYASCKRFCLRGIDVLPAHARSIRLGDFMSLIGTCKERSIADRPVMDQPLLKKRAPQVPAARRIQDELDLDEQEQAIVEFLCAHKRATELELRKALSTRRVAGIVNRLIQKAAAKNMAIVVKKGVGEEGEVYEYGGI